MRVLIFHGYLLHGTGSNVYNAELAQICDRVLAFSRGRIVAELKRGAITVEALTRAVGGIAASPQASEASP